MTKKKRFGKKTNLLKKNNKNFNPFILSIVVISAWLLISFILDDVGFTNDEQEVTLSEAMQNIRNENVDKVIVEDTVIHMELKNGEKHKAKKEPGISFYELLELEQIDTNSVARGITYEAATPWLQIVSNLIFPLLTVLFIFWIFRQAGKSAGGMFNLGKSRAKLFVDTGKGKVTFEDVAGIKEVKKELFEVVDFLKNPKKYQKIGARIPRGVLLVGPSGVGKTLLARAIAGEASVPFYSVAGSEFIEMIVGVGSARVRDLFQVAKNTAPSLIFIDEIDAIGRHRGRSMTGSNDEREQTLNQILVEMDGFDPRSNVIVIAATNRADMLDKALVRPGRFDRHISIDLPDVREREDIIKIHMKGKSFEENIDPSEIAKQTTGFSGADIENMLNESAILAARSDRTSITKRDVIDASTRVKLGPERNLLHTDEEKKVVAYHEAGHALVSTKLPKTDPVNRISIVSRSKSLGHTEYAIQDSKNDYNKTRDQLLQIIQIALGGRAAEELVFKDVSVGAYSDIERATNIAKKMVIDFGMSKLGLVKYRHESLNMFVDSPSDDYSYSEDTAKKIDSEVQRILSEQYQGAIKLLQKNREVLDDIANALIKKETLDRDEYESLVNGNQSKKSSKKTPGSITK